MSTFGTARARRRRLWIGALKFAVATGLVWILWRTGRLDVARLARVRVDGALFGVVIGQIIVMAVPLARWHVLLRARDIGLPPREVVRIGLISYFALLVLPATGGPEIVRVYYASRCVRGRTADLVASVIVDRVSGLLAMCLLGMVFGATLLLGNSGGHAGELVLLAAVCSTALAVVGAGLLWTKPRWAQPLLGRFAPIASLVGSLEAYRSQPRALLMSLALSCVSQLGNCISMYYAFHGVNAPLPMNLVFAATPLFLLAGLVPLTPLGLGVVEGAAEGLFAFMGSPDGAEASMLMRLVTAFACLASGFAFLLPEPAPAEAAVPASRESEASG